MHGKRILVLLFILLLLAGTISARKKDKNNFIWDDIPEDIWNIKEDSSRNIYDAVMVFEKVSADDNKLNDWKCYRVIYRRIRILSSDGREWGDVEAPYLSSKQKLLDIQGRTILPDGTIIKLGSSNIFKKTAVKSKGVKIEQHSFSMPGITDDCVVEYMIKYRLNYPANSWIIQKEMALLHGEYSWKFYIGKSGRNFARALVELGLGTPNYLWLNCGSPKSVKQLPNIKEATELFFEIDDVPPFEKAPYIMPPASLKAKLICYYGSEGTPAAYWGNLASDIKEGVGTYCEENDKSLKVIESLGELATDEEKIFAAYDWLQSNIVNLGYDDLLDKKGKKKEPKNNETVNDVIKRGYGTTGDINMVFYDMLREMNIDAKLAYAADRSEDLLVKEAKYWQFDGELTAIPIDDQKYTYYIPGYKYTEPGTVPWFFEGVDAFIVGGNKSFALVPFTSGNFSTLTWFYSLNISDDFEVSGSIDTRLTGHEARNVRIYLNDSDSLEYENMLKERYEDMFSSAEVDSFQVENLEDINKQLKLKYRAEYPALNVRGNRVLVNICDFITESENPFHSPERTTAVLFDNAFQSMESVQLEIPEGWSVEALPADSTFMNPAGECGIRFTNFGATLNAQINFTLNTPYLRVEHYALIRVLYQNREDFSRQVIVLIKDS